MLVALNNINPWSVKQTRLREALISRMDFRVTTVLHPAHRYPDLSRSGEVE